ncbi:hypothetical protein [Tenacibaculum sp. M341]|uniref:hypothetical protein n=1 Tax=Tenacibaculum sp. M341 TaxID=2530339 RepID=UPI00104541FB|nr:hypothetical protein [Tenacibaculum sp. M341]TCI92201.1 hypothetical protein EYW44_08450 [Tenacibaculum sp. M341]
MGLNISRISFHKKLPSVEQIQKQFKKQTGLDIWLKADITLLELPLDGKSTIEKLSQDTKKYDDFKKKKFNQEWETIKDESNKINHINSFQFYNNLFYEINFYITEKIIEIEFDANRNYFAISLNKTLFDLGGEFVNDKNEPIKNNTTINQWKKLKHWNNYKWYNRPKK